jgi:hypothetical protein
LWKPKDRFRASRETAANSASARECADDSVPADQHRNARELHLNVHPVGAGNHPGARRRPGADPLTVARIEGYLDVARLPGMVTTLGSTEREALERRQRLDELANTREAVGSIAAKLGLRSEDLELDEPVPRALREVLPTGPGPARPTVQLAQQGLIVRDILRRGRVER